MICHRCQGPMVEEELRDWGGGLGHNDSDSWRCIVCGEIVDPVIMANRDEANKLNLRKRKKHVRHGYRTIPISSR